MLGRIQYPDGTTVPAAQWHGGGLRLNGGSSKVEEPWVGQRGRQGGGRQASLGTSASLLEPLLPPLPVIPEHQS